MKFNIAHLQIVALANLLPLDDAVDELDSFMYQTVRQIFLMTSDLS